MRKLSISYEPRPIFAILLLVLICIPTTARQQPSPNKVPADPALRPKFRAMVDAMNQRAREQGLVSINEDEDQEAFVKRRRDAQLREDFEKVHIIGTEKLALLASAPSLDLRDLSD